MTNADYPIKRPNGYRLEKDKLYTNGPVATPFGFVVVYSEGKYTSLNFIFNSRQHSRTVKRRYTPRGLVTLAARFAAEIVGAAK